jgi:preprotein translocase subunit SecG
MLTTVITIIHVIISFALLAIVLLQSGKGQGIGAGLGGANAAAQKMFGGGNTQSALGKSTVVVAAIFMSTSLSLAYLSSQPQSAMDLNEGDANFGRSTGEVVQPQGSTGGGSQAAPSGGSESGSTGSTGSTGSAAPSGGAGTGSSETGSDQTGD